MDADLRRHDVEAGPLGQALSYLVSDVTAAPNVMAGLVPTIYRSTKIAQMAGTRPTMTWSLEDLSPDLSFWVTQRQ